MLGPVAQLKRDPFTQERKPLRGGAGVTENVMAAVDDAVRGACAAHPAANVYLATQSFGGRAAVHWVLRRLEKGGRGGRKKEYPLWDGADGAGARALPPNFRGVVACGYPLAHKTTDRSLPLKMLGLPDDQVVY